MATTSEDMLNYSLVNQISNALTSLISKFDIRNIILFLNKHVQDNPRQLKTAIINNKMIMPCIFELGNLCSRKDKVFYELFFTYQKEDADRHEQYAQWLPTEMALEVFDLLSGKRMLLRLLVENGLEENIRKNVNTYDRDGNTMLHEAIKRKVDPRIVEMLIQYGAIVDVENDSEETPLDIAIRYNKDSSIICLLLERSMYVSKWPTLSYAIDHADSVLLQLLLNNGADVNAKDLIGDPPLHLAIYRNNAEIAEILLRNGADVNTQNNAGETPLDYARKYGGQKLIALFEKYENEWNENEKPLGNSLALNPYAFHNESYCRQTAAVSPRDTPSNSSRSPS